jgi:RNA polymerase sigma-70 factor (ECF subfamily)
VTSTQPNRLARICAYSAQAPEWEQFVRLVTPSIALAARRIGETSGDSSSATVGEIVQEVLLKLCEDDRRILREFEDRGSDSFLKLMRTITTSVGVDYFRRVNAEKRGGRRDDISLRSDIEPDLVIDSRLEAALERRSILGQLDGLLRLFPETVSVRDRNLFWLHYRHGMTAEAISRIPVLKLSPKGVESKLRRLTRLLRNTVMNGKPEDALDAKRANKSSKLEGFYSTVTVNQVERP